MRKGEINSKTPQQRWEPNRQTIDRITPNNPCLLSSYGEDYFLANTEALKAAGLEKTVLKGMKTDNQGKATGLLYKGSPAILKVRAVVKPKSEQRKLNEYRTGLKLIREMGIVEIHDMIRSFDELERYLILQEKGELTCRVWIRPWLVGMALVLRCRLIRNGPLKSSICWPAFPRKAGSVFPYAW